ncbi:RDD family protein [Terrilactibacillus laevilacticus]|uniref:RDD family protein n=1 Tax=Terrilactibacillus laevilacticus TaxID=1380157 RepID=A0ABW5PN61_9BACI|nr:RDD family protein [Terrilactibacillus laevilacticus]
MKPTQTAGFWIRLAANIIDGIIVMVIDYLLGAFIFGKSYLERDSGIGTVQIFGDVVSLLYFVLIPIVWSGYLPGKRLCGIRIVKLDGQKPTIGTMLLRYIVGGLVYTVSFGICLIISIFMVAFREDKRAIHDFIAGTYVTKNPPAGHKRFERG